MVTVIVNLNVSLKLSFRMLHGAFESHGSGHGECSKVEFDTCIYNSMLKHMKHETPDESGCTSPWIMLSNGSGTDRICLTQANRKLVFMEYKDHMTDKHATCSSPCQTLIATLGANTVGVSEKICEISLI